jgi:Putative bacterial sensory transduction regulator
MRWIWLIVMLAVPLVGQAGPLPDGGISAPELATALKTAGYPADITNDRVGDPMIRSSTGKVLFEVYFFQCGTQLRCTSIQFTAPFHRKAATPSTIAAWNRDRRFARAFLDFRGVAWISMDVEATHGMTIEALGANIQRWVSVLSAFDVFAAR